MHPIWKDQIVTLGSSGPYKFRIFYEDKDANPVVVYEGKAYARPGETDVKVRVNDVIADVLARRIDIIKPVIDNDSMDRSMIMPLVFETDAWIGGAWVSKARDTYFPDWSYDENFDGTTDPLAVPINGRVSKWQYILNSRISESAVTVKRIRANGTSSNKTVYPKDTYANAFELDAVTNGGGTVILDVQTYVPNFVKLQIGTVVYDLVDDCDARFVLYYINAYGGWDSFLCEGLCDVSDGQNRMTHGQEYDNADHSDRGTVVRVNELTRRYTFRTGWLTDDESARMHHLLNSPDVYVHDLLDDVIQPVVLTGSETRYKTFRTNGRRFIDYTITAQLAQERMRR